MSEYSYETTLTAPGREEAQLIKRQCVIYRAKEDFISLLDQALKRNYIAHQDIQIQNTILDGASSISAQLLPWEIETPCGYKIKTVKL